MHFDLQRFVDAQTPLYEQVCAELHAGQKRSHWMWFVFPQLRALGRSTTAKHYGLASRAEAEAYLKHPILGARLTECTRLVNSIAGRSVEDIFGYPDHLKFHSSMTLFAQVNPAEPVFDCALNKYFGGQPDSATLKLLRQGRSD